MPAPAKLPFKDDNEMAVLGDDPAPLCREHLRITGS